MEFNIKHTFSVDSFFMKTECLPSSWNRNYVGSWSFFSEHDLSLNHDVMTLIVG